MTSDEKAFILQRAIECNFEDKRRAEAVQTIVDAYFAEYTDATEMGEEFQMDFGNVFELLFPSGEMPDGREFEDLIKKKDDA